MRFTTQSTHNGVLAREFTLGDIPGVLWTPADASTSTDRRPLILLAHGGGQHKKAPGMDVRGHRFAKYCGFAAVAIDAPGHGDRPKTTQDRGERAAQAVPEWQAILAALLAQRHADGPVGFWGVSMGSEVGIRLVAAEPRIDAAVFGLAGHPDLLAPASRITVPVQFLVQWDDELVPREASLALFDALGSPEKTLHANPGEHSRLPRFELDSGEHFFTRHLATADDPVWARYP